MTILASSENTGDIRLLELYRSGKSEAFQEIYRRHRDALYHHARIILRDDGLAEDAVHETFLELSRSGDPGRAAEGSLGPFLHQVLRRKAIDRQRTEGSVRRREAQFSDRWVREAARDVDLGQLEDLNTALSQLPGEQLSVVLLHVHSKMTFQEFFQSVSTFLTQRNFFCKAAVYSFSQSALTSSVHALNIRGSI